MEIFTKDPNFLKTNKVNAGDFLNEKEIKRVNTLRKQSYLSESDPLFMEAIRKDAAGDIEGAQAARAQALQAVADIKTKYPLPEVDA